MPHLQTPPQWPCQITCGAPGVLVVWFKFPTLFKIPLLKIFR